jgi:hypothetical protein
MKLFKNIMILTVACTAYSLTGSQYERGSMPSLPPKPYGMLINEVRRMQPYQALTGTSFSPELVNLTANNKLSYDEQRALLSTAIYLHGQWTGDDQMDLMTLSDLWSNARMVLDQNKIKAEESMLLMPDYYDSNLKLFNLTFLENEIKMLMEQGRRPDEIKFMLQKEFHPLFTRIWTDTKISNQPNMTQLLNTQIQNTITKVMTDIENEKKRLESDRKRQEMIDKASDTAVRAAGSVGKSILKQTGNYFQEQWEKYQNRNN